MLANFQAGNEMYQQGKYIEAVEKYQSAIETGYTSPELYYNLGNSYYKLGDIGHSILYYEKALKIQPHDPDVAYNLEIAQLQVVDKLAVPPPFIFTKLWNSVKNALNISQLGTVTLIIYVLLMVLLMLRLVLRNEQVKRFAKIAFIPVLIICIFSTLVFVQRVQEDIYHKYGVILVEKIDIMSSPARDATEVFALHEGLKVRITDESGDFVKIELADGKVGWMKKSALEVI